MSNIELIKEARRQARSSTHPESPAYINTLISGLCDALEAATADETFAVLGVDDDGEKWITDEKYDDVEGARAYAKRYGGIVHRRSAGNWVKVS